MKLIVRSSFHHFSQVCKTVLLHPHVLHVSLHGRPSRNDLAGSSVTNLTTTCLQGNSLAWQRKWKASLLSRVIICIQQDQSLLCSFKICPVASAAGAVNDNVRGCRRAAHLHRNGLRYECVRNRIRAQNCRLCRHVSVSVLSSPTSECRRLSVCLSPFF